MKVTMISNYKLFKAKSLEAIQGALEKNHCKLLAR